MFVWPSLRTVELRKARYYLRGVCKGGAILTNDDCGADRSTMRSHKERSGRVLSFREAMHFRPGKRRLSKAQPALIALVLMGSMAAAGEKKFVTLCRFGDAQGVLTCSVYNPFQQAIASIEYSLVATETDREVPWGFSSGSLSVGGGVEPGETVELAFEAPDLPERAKGREILIVVDRARAFGVNGNILNAVQSSSNTSKLTDLEADRLTSAIAPCWNVGALSVTALRTSVVLSVQVDATGLPDAGSIAFVEGSIGSETDKRQAFEVARRAVIRCGARGLPYGPKMDEPSTLVIEFAPDGIRLF